MLSRRTKESEMKTWFLLVLLTDGDCWAKVHSSICVD